MGENLDLVFLCLAQQKTIPEPASGPVKGWSLATQMASLIADDLNRLEKDPEFHRRPFVIPGPSH
jgi:hypothetical protein